MPKRISKERIGYQTSVQALAMRDALQAAINDLQGKLDLVDKDLYVGPPSNTYAGLPPIPTDASAQKPYVSYLTAADGAYPKGTYITDGAAWELQFEYTSDIAPLDEPKVLSKAGDIFGTTSPELMAIAARNEIGEELQDVIDRLEALEREVTIAGDPENATFPMQINGVLTGSIATINIVDPDFVTGMTARCFVNDLKRGDDAVYPDNEIYLNSLPVDGSTISISVDYVQTGVIEKRLTGSIAAATAEGDPSVLTVSGVTEEIDETPIWTDKPSELTGDTAQVTLLAPGATDLQYNFDFHIYNPEVGEYEDLTTRTANNALGVVDFGLVPGFPVNVGIVDYRVRRWDRATDGSNVAGTLIDFDNLSSQSYTVQTATVEVVTGSSVTFDTITRKYSNDTIPASFVNKYFGPNSVAGETTELPKANATTETYSVVTANNQVESAATIAQLIERLRSIPDGAEVNITGSLSDYTLPSDVGGSPGAPKFITGYLGAGRNYIKASNLVFKDGPLEGALRFEGSGLTGFNVAATGAGSFELYGEQTQPRTSDPRVIKCSFTNPDYAGRIAIKTSDGVASDDKTPLRFYIDSCYFNGYLKNAIAGVGLRENYPAKKTATYGYITRNHFERCREEIITTKDVAMFIALNFFDGRSDGGFGWMSLRNTHDCVFVNNIYAGSVVKWMTMFGYNHILQNNIVLMDRSYRPLELETPAAGVRSAAWGMEHYRIAAAFSKHRQNMFFAPSGYVSDAGIMIREAYGDSGYQNWQNLNPPSGFDIEGIEMDRNMYIHDGTLPGYLDETGRMPESKWNADNTARIANQIPFSETGLVSTGPSTTFNTAETYAGIWEGDSDVVIPLPPWVADGSFAELS